MATEIKTQTQQGSTPVEFDSEKNVHDIDTVDRDAINAVNSNQEKDHGQESDGSSFKQGGVRKAEAITQTWNKKTLWIMLGLFYLVGIIDMIVVALQSNLDPYVTSSFGQHGLTGIVPIVSSLLGGSSSLTIAKIIDVWGRVEGFCCMVILAALGQLMKALCRNVETYAAAATFYWVAHLGLMYTIDVMIADMTTLRNRMLAFTITSTPTIASSFIGPALAEHFQKNYNFRWAFGAFGIVLVAVCIPPAIILHLQLRKAKKLGVLEPHVSNRKWWQSIYHYAVQFDIFGILLVTAGFSLILLPFSLAPRQAQSFATPFIIVMLILGVLCLVGFYCWEKWGAPVQFFPFELLKDRTIIGACMLYGLMFASIFIWDAYYFSYLQVVHRQSITHSGYILNSFSLSAAVLSPFIAVLISFTGDYKYTGLVGMPFMALGTGLLMHFRRPDADVGFLVMCQVFNGIGTGFFSTTAQLAVMTAVNHQNVAVAIALWGMFGGIGAAIGNAVASALWNNMVPELIAKNLPEEYMDQLQTIYGDLVVQMSFPDGHPVRDAIVEAYAEVMRRMIIGGAVIIPFVFLSVIVWRNVNVKKLEKERGTQSKGTLF